MFLKEAEFNLSTQSTSRAYSDQIVLGLLMELINLGSKPGPHNTKFPLEKCFSEPGSMLKALTER